MFNMPQLTSQYGTMRQFDIVTTVDQERFLKTKRNALISGFSIDDDGKILGTLNLVSYMKMAPKSLFLRTQKKKGSSDDDDEEEQEEREKKLLKDNFVNMTDSSDWEIGRTVYSTFTIKGTFGIEKISEDTQELALNVESIQCTKLDFHKGHPDEHAAEAGASAEAEEEEEDFSGEDEPDESLTQEGGLLQALLNMHVKK